MSLYKIKGKKIVDAFSEKEALDAYWFLVPSKNLAENIDQDFLKVLHFGGYIDGEVMDTPLEDCEDYEKMTTSSAEEMDEATKDFFKNLSSLHNNSSNPDEDGDGDLEKRIWVDYIINQATYAAFL